MTASPATDRLVRPAGLLLGVLLAVAALIAWRVPGGEKTLGAAVNIEALQTGAIGVQPLHPFVNVPSLLPGRAAGGKVALRNQTGVPMAVRLTALPSTRDLDSLLEVEVSSAGKNLYDGSLAGLRQLGTRPLRLASGESRALGVRVSLPAAARSGYQGRLLDISLQLDSGRTR
jgi:hypothetical protein